MQAKDASTRKSADRSAADNPADVTQATVGNGGKGGQRAAIAPKQASQPPRGKSARAAADTAYDVGGKPRPNRQTTLPPPDAFAEERDDVLVVINELEDQLDRYEEIRETLERELTETRQQNQVATQRVQELEWQVVTLQTRVEALEQLGQDVSLLEEEVADANAQAQRLAEQFSRAQKENSRVDADLKFANKQLAGLWSVSKERDGLRVDIKNACAKLGQLEREHQEVLQERDTLQTKLHETQLALEETHSARNQAEAGLRAADDRNEELGSALEDAQQKIETVRTEKKDVQAQLTHMERENIRLVEQQQFYERELTSLRSTNRKAESALANVKKAFSEVRAALAETKSRTRRRAIESWPRTCSALRGITETSGPEVDPEAAEATAAAMPVETADSDPEQVATNSDGGRP